MKNKTKQKIYVGLLLTVVMVMGLSYAYFFLRKEQTNSNVIGTRSCLDTSLTEDTSEIILTDAFPISDERGLTKDPFTFTLTNNCDSYVDVQITLYSEYRTSTSSTYLKDDYVKVNLSPKGATTGTSNILSSLSLGDIDTTRKAYILEETGLKGNETKSYDLRLWMNSETTNEQGLNKTWKGKIIVTVTAAKELPTLLSKILGENNANVSEPQTTPGAEISADTEAVLASTEDDYGTSYYFRGAVTNNFVEYANMCWRIVRVTGDGSIKLVLYNYNGLTSTNNTPSSSTPCNVTGDMYAYARYDGDTYHSYHFKFNSSYNDNAYIGLMYGTAGASSYADAHANTNASTILTNLNKWYTNVLSKQANFKDSQLADTIWCNDKSVVTDTAFNPGSPGSITLGTNYGYAKNANYYGAVKRLVQASSLSAGGTGPTLICPNDNNGGKLSKFTVSDTKYGNGNLDKKIGLLTADELALAGYAGGELNSTTYLQENATDGWWWSLSPYSFDGSNVFVWGVNGSNGDFGLENVDGDFEVRPSISLKSTTNVTGNGTSDTPYKIVS